MRILRNPSAASFSALRLRAEFGGVRAIVTDAGDLFAWNGSTATHADVMEDHAVYGTRLDVFKTCVTLVLAGGAIELLDSPEKAEEFLAAHGHPGASIGDMAVLERICDAETALIAANPNVRRAIPDIAEMVADIDPRVDWTATTLAMVRDFAEVVDRPNPPGTR